MEFSLSILATLLFEVFPAVQSVCLRRRTGGLQFIARLFESAKTDYSREGEDRMDCRVI